MVVFVVFMQGLPDPRALKSGAAAFKEIAEGCSEDGRKKRRNHEESKRCLHL